MKKLLLVLCLFASPALANPIVAPLEGYITWSALHDLVEKNGPLVWKTDGDMIIAQYWDENPGHDATVKHPGYALKTYEDADATWAVLDMDAVNRLKECGHWQLDFGLPVSPSDPRSMKALVVDTGLACAPPPRVDPTCIGCTPPQPNPTCIGCAPTPHLPEPVPEPATILMLGAGLLAVAWMLRKKVA